MATTTPCPKCGRPLGEQAKRCLYCGASRITAAPGTPEFEAQKREAEVQEKKVELQKAIYSAGMGAGMNTKKPSLTEQLRAQSGPVKVLAALFAIPLVAIWPPWGIKWLKELFMD
jgi:hypothetical protein